MPINTSPLRAALVGLATLAVAMGIGRFAFTPLLLINSIATMDYMWALTAILSAYYSVQTGRRVWAGVLIGVAAGFRLQGAAIDRSRLEFAVEIIEKRYC